MAIGQPMGDRRRLAIRNRELWIQLASEASVPIEECGSLHLAHHADELQILEEFRIDRRVGKRPADRGRDRARTPFANPDGLKGRFGVQQSVASILASLFGRFLSYLRTLGVEFAFGHRVHSIEGERIESTRGNRWEASRIVLCSGVEFQSLFPDEHAKIGMKRCKLQMMRTKAPVPGVSLGPHLASGLTLRHYESFSKCPTLPVLQERIASQFPELDRFGIHVMASQYQSGEIILGDSHVYDHEITPFRSERIDQLMLQELQKVYRFPTWEIDERWEGEYAKLPDRAWARIEMTQHCEAINGFGGSGMSMSLAVTEGIINHSLKESEG